MCDTDGLFIAATPTGRLVACPGGDQHLADGKKGIRTATWAAVERDVVAPFARLNPYDTDAVSGSILELEDENFEPATGLQREIECFSIAAKRYALFTRTPDGRPVIVGKSDDPKRSRHGLGHLLRPTPPDQDWISEWWTRLLCVELGLPEGEPPWFGDIAAGRLTVTTPHEERAWRTYNQARPYPHRVRPWNFAMTAHPKRLRRGTAGPRSLTAPLQDTPAQRLATPWIDRHDPANSAYFARTSSTADHIPGTVPVQTYRDYFTEYRGHPEHKALGSDGKPCHPWTRGLLRPPVVSATGVQRIGKETVIGVDDDPDPTEPISPHIRYPRPACPACGHPVDGKRTYCSDRCRKKASRTLP
jgi:hypothetical protein